MSYFQFVDIPKCHKQNNFFNLNNSCCVSNQVKTNREANLEKEFTKFLNIAQSCCDSAVNM